MEYEGLNPSLRGIKLDEIGYKYRDGKSQHVLFDIHRKTKWQALKNLERDGYVRCEGKEWFMTDKLWDDLKDEIVRFKLAENKGSGVGHGH